MAALENAVPTVKLVHQLETIPETLHSLTPEVKEIPSVIIVLRVLWAKAAQIIDRAVEAEAAALDIEFQQI